MVYDRGKFFRELHQKAKARKEVYSKYFGEEEKPKYNEFLKNENPVDKHIEVYDVSYQVSYKSDENALIMETKQTFRVYAIKEFETESNVYQRTKDMILDMKGQETGQPMNLASRDYFNDNDSYLNIKVEPRGLEKQDKRVLNNNNYNQLLQNNYVVDEMDTSFDVKNKKGTRFKQKVNLYHFM